MQEVAPVDRAPGSFECRVLVVEDEEDLRTAIRDVLRSGGCAVDTAASVPEALRHVLGREYDVVISDIRLPKTDGIELTRLLSRRVRSPRIVLMTSAPEPETVLEGYSAGATHVLPKPLSLSALLRIVKEVRPL